MSKKLELAKLVEAIVDHLELNNGGLNEYLEELKTPVQCVHHVEGTNDIVVELANGQVFEITITEQTPRARTAPPRPQARIDNVRFLRGKI